MLVTKGIGLRHMSVFSKETLKTKRIYFYALPLTTRKTFIHCKYNDSIFPDGKKALETKITDKAVSMWKNFSNSESSINKKVVSVINRILANIPWLETCLLSMPSQKFITRKLKQDNEEERKKHEDLNEEGLKHEESRVVETKFVTHEEILQKNIESKDLEMFHYYYPNKLTNIQVMLDTFKPEFKSQYDLHRKGILKDLCMMPLTIPFALVPLLPNIPGFYLLYRIYCHIKVIASLKYLVVLLKDGHLNYEPVDTLTEIYLKTEDVTVRNNVIEHLGYMSELGGELEGKLPEEKLLISEDVAKELCAEMDDPACAEKLVFAIQQERKLQQKREEGEKEE